MKSLIFCVFVILACICLQINADCEVDGELLKVGKFHRNCMEITCRPSGTFDRRGCARHECRQGTQVGVKDQDNSKSFPECCSQPICDLSNSINDKNHNKLEKKLRRVFPTMGKLPYNV